MSLLDAVDLYCERTHPGLWAEPVNVLTNGAFLLAAWLLVRRQFPSEARADVRLMAGLLSLVGVCSGAFHLAGEVWGEWADSGAIVLFIAVYLLRYITGVVRSSAWVALLTLLAMAMLARVISALGALHLNGSEAYLPPWLVLVALAHWAQRKSPASAPWMLAAAMSFPLSLLLRTVDLAVCPRFALGTHFAWHLLNALVLYLCVRGLAAGRHERSGRFLGLLTAATVMERDR